MRPTQMDTTLASPGQRRRSATKKYAIPERNPYSPTSLTATQDAPARICTAVRTIWLATLIAVAYVVADTGPQLFLTSEFRRSLSEFGFIVFLFVPAIYWEAFCRIAPRPQSRLLAIGSSVFRCAALYFLPNLVFHNVLIRLGTSLRVATSLRLRYWPDVPETIGLGILLGGILLVMYDYSRASRCRSQNSAEPRDAREGRHAVFTNGDHTGRPR